MAKMVRKQIYIQEHQERMLKDAAVKWQVSEAEVVRLAIEGLRDAPAPSEVRRRAWDEIEEFIRTHRTMDVPQTGRTWTRDELYEDRLSRYGVEQPEPREDPASSGRP